MLLENIFKHSSVYVILAGVAFLRFFLMVKASSSTVMEDCAKGVVPRVVQNIYEFFLKLVREIRRCRNCYHRILKNSLSWWRAGR